MVPECACVRSQLLVFSIAFHRLSLLSSNIQAERETCLRSFLTKRLERIQPLEGSGNIVSIPAGKVYDINAMVYFYLMTEGGLNSPSLEYVSGKRTFLVCFIAGIESGLELYPFSTFILNLFAVKLHHILN